MKLTIFNNEDEVIGWQSISPDGVLTADGAGLWTTEVPWYPMPYGTPNEVVTPSHGSMWLLACGLRTPARCDWELDDEARAELAAMGIPGWTK